MIDIMKTVNLGNSQFYTGGGSRDLLNPNNDNSEIANSPENQMIMAAPDKTAELLRQNPTPLQAAPQPVQLQAKAPPEVVIIGQTSTPYKEFETRMNTIRGMTDSLERMDALGDLNAAYQGHVAKTLGTLRQMADDKAGVTTLMAQVKASEARDPTLPNYKYHMTDSPFTLNLKRNLDEAQRNSALIYADSLTSNVELKSLEGKMNSFVHTENAIVGKMMDGKSSQADKEEALISAVGTNGLIAAGLVDPNLKTDADKARFASKNYKNPEFAAIMENATRPQNLVTMAMDKDNAQTVTAVAHMNALLKSSVNNPTEFEAVKANTLKDMKTLQDMISDEGLIATKDKAGGKESDRVKSYEKELENASAYPTAVEKSKATKAAKISLALEVFTAQKKQDFLGNVNNWDSFSINHIKTSPNLKPIYDKLLSAGKEPSISNMVKMANTIEDINSKRAIVDEITKVSLAAVTLNDKGLYGTVGIKAVENEIDMAIKNSIITNPSLLGLIGSGVGYAADKAKLLGAPGAMFWGGVARYANLVTTPIGPNYWDEVNAKADATMKPINDFVYSRGDNDGSK